MLKTLKKEKVKPFKSLSIPLQKRRIIKDALAQIEDKKVKVAPGTYMSMLGNRGEYIYYGRFDGRKAESLQKIFQESKGPACEVCAKGALFASCVLNVNKVDTKDEFYDERFQKNKLKKWFSERELDMIETAFERKVCTDSTDILTKKMTLKNGKIKMIKTPLAEKCIVFGKQYSMPKARLIAILNNVLENRVFKP